MLKETRADGGPDAQFTAYVITGGVLALWYRAHGVTLTLQVDAFASSVGSQRAKLGPLLGRGENTPDGFLQAMCSALTGSQLDVGTAGQYGLHLGRLHTGKAGSSAPARVDPTARDLREPAGGSRGR